MATVAFLGTGLLGSGMVEGMLRRGDAVTVWNRTGAKARALEPLGAKVAATPADAVDGADRVHMTMPDDAVVDEMMAAIRPRLRPDAVVVDHSTTSPRGAATRVAAMEKSGIRFLHAPVFMSPQMARDAVGICSSRPARRFRRGSKRARQDDERGVYSARRATSPRRTRSSATRCSSSSPPASPTCSRWPEARHLADRRARGVLEVPAGRPHQDARREDGARRLQCQLRADDGAQGHPADDRGRRRPAAVALPAIAQAMDKAIAQGHGQEDLGAIAAEVVAPVG